MTTAQGQLLVALVGLILTGGLLGTTAVAVWKWLGVKIGGERLRQLESIARQCVRAVDQVATAHGWDNLDKRQAAATRIAAFCAAHGIPVTGDMIGTVLEAAVGQLREWEEVNPDPAATPEPPPSAPDVTPFIERAGPP